MSTWHCSDIEQHDEHRWAGDGYYGPEGYLCTGRSGDVPVHVPELGTAFKKSQVDAFTARVEQAVRQHHIEEVLLLMCNNADDELRLALARLARGGSDA